MDKMAKSTRITGIERTRLTSRLRKDYEKGASLRELAEETGRSYGFIHRLLTEDEVTLRSRGGNTRKES